MLHLAWYILVGLIAGIIAKSIMHAVFIRPVLFSPRWVRSWCYLFVTNSRFDFRTCRIAREWWCKLVTRGD
jgi:hypothetical protein